MRQLPPDAATWLQCSWRPVALVREDEVHIAAGGSRWSEPDAKFIATRGTGDRVCREQCGSCHQTWRPGCNVHGDLWHWLQSLQRTMQQLPPGTATWLLLEITGSCWKTFSTKYTWSKCSRGNQNKSTTISKVYP